MWILADSINSVPDVKNAIKNKLEISFFPEGGSLVDGVPSVVAFKVTDAYGRGCDVTGEIFTSDGEFVTAFRSSHKGMGTFLLTPVSGTRYLRLPQIRKGDTIVGEVPVSFHEGLVLKFQEIKTRELL